MQAKGNTFASVHDCFWTQAATVPVMKEQLRLAFIELHSQPILGNSRFELIERYRGYIVKKERGFRGRYSDTGKGAFGHFLELKNRFISLAD
jgi:DNA-directed RNA polymerase